jgi:hypothetical protein
MPHPQFKVFHVWGCVLSPGKSAGLRISAKTRTPYRRPPQYCGDSRGTNVAGHQFLLRKRDALLRAAEDHDFESVPCGLWQAGLIGLGVIEGKYRCGYRFAWFVASSAS